jgi:hypothetical protein
MATHIESKLDMELSLHVSGMVSDAGECVDPQIDDVRINGKSIFQGVAKDAINMIKMTILEEDLDAIRSQIEYDYSQGAA